MYLLGKIADLIQKAGGPDRIRTGNNPGINRLLYQLSYGPEYTSSDKYTKTARERQADFVIPGS